MEESLQNSVRSAQINGSFLTQADKDNVITVMQHASFHYALYILIFVSLFYTLHSRFFYASSRTREPFDSPSSSSFALKSVYSGDSFFSRFRYEAIPDPTHGFVNYVSKDESASRNLTWVGAFDGVSYISVDTKETLHAGSWPGRASVRLLSKDAHEEGTLVVIDVFHMPWYLQSLLFHARCASS